MYMVLYDVLTSVVLMPLLYVELHFGVPLVVALLERLPFAAETNLAVFYILTSLLALPLLLGTVEPCAAALERRWPSSLSDALSRPRFIHGAGAGGDPLARVREEHARVVQNFAVYFDAVREGWRMAPLREASRSLLDDIGGFLDALPVRRRGPRGRGAKRPAQPASTVDRARRRARGAVHAARRTRSSPGNCARCMRAPWKASTRCCT